MPERSSMRRFRSANISLKTSWVFLFLSFSESLAVLSGANPILPATAFKNSTVRRRPRFLVLEVSHGRAYARFGTGTFLTTSVVFSTSITGLPYPLYVSDCIL